MNTIKGLITAWVGEDEKVEFLEDELYTPGYNAALRDLRARAGELEGEIVEAIKTISGKVLAESNHPVQAWYDGIRCLRESIITSLKTPEEGEVV